MIQRVYVSQDRKATFSCPQCGLVKEKDVSKYIGLKQQVRLKCKCVCSYTYPVIFERRQHIRKSVQLPGSYSSGKEQGTLVVENISRTGLKLKLNCETSLQVESRMRIKFTLDDVAGSEVQSEVVVRNVRPPVLGVEFTSMNHYGKLGAYLLYEF